MSEITTMLLAEHRQVALDAQHPARAMAYELALEKRLRRRARWGRLRWRRSVAARREAALGSGC